MTHSKTCRNQSKLTVCIVAKSNIAFIDFNPLIFRLFRLALAVLCPPVTFWTKIPKSSHYGHFSDEIINFGSLCLLDGLEIFDEPLLFYTLKTTGLLDLQYSQYYFLKFGLSPIWISQMKTV